MDWHLDPPVLGLTFLCVSPGLAGNPAGGMLGQDKDHMKGTIETLALGAIASGVTKSWWPLVGPLIYLSLDFLYYQQYKGEPANVEESPYHLEVVN